MPSSLAKVTHTMTVNRLRRNGVTQERLQEIFQNSLTYLHFYDEMRDLGIERKAAKSMVAKFTSKGICQHICEEERIEDTTTTPNSFEYNSLCTDRIEKDYFYEMFVDEFFYPPEQYIVTFGSFTVEEIQTMDDCICQLFKSRYGAYDEFYDVENIPIKNIADEKMFVTYSAGIVDAEETSVVDSESSCLAERLINTCEEEYETQIKTDCITVEANDKIVNELNGTRCTPDDEKPSFDVLNSMFSKHMAKMKELKYRQTEDRINKLISTDENWDDDIPEVSETFQIPTDRGRLAKVVPIGMTEDCLNGKSYSARVPLFNHFPDLDIKDRPRGGISGKKWHKKTRKKEKLFFDEHDNVVRDANGQAFMLF